MPSTRQTLLNELTRRWPATAAAVALMLLGAAVTLVHPLLFKALFDEAIPQKDYAHTAWLLAGMIGVPLVAIGLSYGQEYWRIYLGEHVTRRLRRDLFAHLLHTRMEALEKLGSAEAVFRMTRICGRIGNMYVAQELLPGLANLILLAGTLGLMFFLDPVLTGVAAAALPLTYGITALLLGRMQRLDRSMGEILERGEAYLSQVFRGVRTVRLFNGEAREKRRWDGWLEGHTSHKLKGEAFHEVMVKFPNEVVNSVVIGLLFGYGAYRIMGGHMSVGELVAFAAYAPRAYSALRLVMGAYVGTRRAQVHAEKLDAVFAMPVEEGAVEGGLAGGGAPRIEFEGVSFSYERGAGVKDISFVLEPGSFVGVVGPTGAGKSTLIDLLLRFYAPQAGRILVDGTDIAGVAPSAVRRATAVVPQQIFLWNAGIGDNISYPQEGAERKRLDAAAAMAQLADFVGQQPEGYDTAVGEEGLELSGGERQRLALARVFWRRARVLLVDEATSALDALTEEQVRAALETARGGKTTLMVAHRLASVMHADRILVIDGDGRLAEEGAPAELVRRGGLFARMYRAQSLEGPGA